MGKLIDPERLKSRLESYAETYKSAGMDVPYDMAVVTDIIDRSINSYDVDYVAEMLQGLEPQELKYISKVCEMLIAEGEL